MFIGLVAVKFGSSGLVQKPGFALKLTGAQWCELGVVSAGGTRMQFLTLSDK